jgi:hypothetical protein
LCFWIDVVDCTTCSSSFSLRYSIDLEHGDRAGLRERIRPFELDRILGGEHEERFIERVGTPLDRDPVLLHGLEKCRLGLGRCAIDLVGEHDVGEDRTGHECHAPSPRLGVLLNDVRSGDVRRHQVRRELDAGELEVEHLGQRVNQQRLGQSGHPDDKAVASGEERRQRLLDYILLPDDQLSQLGEDSRPPVAQLVRQRNVVRRVQRHVVPRNECAHVSGNGWVKKTTAVVR